MNVQEPGAGMGRRSSPSTKDDVLDRVRVLYGWIYRQLCVNREGGVVAVALTFVPDSSMDYRRHLRT